MNKLNLKKQMPKNLAMNVVSFVTNVLIGLWLIPYLVKYIGIAAYGLVPLAMIFSEYIGLIINSLNGAINRYLLIALQKNDYLKANQVFNTSLFMIFIFIIIQSIIMIVILLNLSVVISIPDGLLNDALYLFAFTFLGFTTSLVRAVISTPLFAHNRLDLLRFLDILLIVIQAGGVILFFTIDQPELKYVGISNFIASLIVFFLALYFSIKLAPQLKINTKMIDLTQAKELSSMGGWLLVTQIGALLFLKIDLLLANKFLGPIQAGNYAVVIQWNSLLRAFAGMLSGVLTPIVMIYYARGEIDKLISMLKVGIKLMGIFLAIPIGIIVALSGEILEAWLGADFRHLSFLMSLSILPLLINVSVLPLLSVNISYNRVKVPGLVTLFLGVVNLLLSLVLILYTDLKLYGLVIAGGIVLTMKNSLFVPIYAAYILDIKKSTFIKYQFIGLFFFVVTFFVTKLFAILILPDTPLSLLINILIATIISVLIALLYVFSNKEMSPITNVILDKINIPFKVKGN